MNLDTGHIRDSMSCGANVCPYCIHTNVWRWGRALSVAAPSRYAVFTQLSGDWQTDRASIAALFRVLDRKGYRLRAAYTIERNPAGTGFHLNVWWWGPDVPQSLLSEVAVSLGWGQVVHAQRWQGGRNEYGMKDALGYGMKDAVSDAQPSPPGDLSPAQSDYLVLNGGALCHARRGFWRNGVGGEDLGSMRAAFRASFAEEPRKESGQWVMYEGSHLLAHGGTSASETPPAEVGTSEPAPEKSPGLLPAGVQSVSMESLPLFSLEPATVASSVSATTSQSSANVARGHQKWPKDWLVNGGKPPSRRRNCS